MSHFSFGLQTVKKNSSLWVSQSWNVTQLYSGGTVPFPWLNGNTAMLSHLNAEFRLCEYPLRTNNWSFEILAKSVEGTTFSQITYPLAMHCSHSTNTVSNAFLSLHTPAFPDECIKEQWRKDVENAVKFTFLLPRSKAKQGPSKKLTDNGRKYIWFSSPLLYW